MKGFILGLIVLLVSGCASMHPWSYGDNLYLFRDNPDFIGLAQQLTEDYLKGQKKGESYSEAALKYGSGVVEFYGLEEYRYLESYPKNELPCLKYRVKASNRIGGVFWDDLIVCFICDRKLFQNFYGGLSISEVIRP